MRTSPMLKGPPRAAGGPTNFASFVNQGARTQNTTGTTATSALPASRVNGNLLIAMFTTGQAKTFTLSGTGWVKLMAVPATAGSQRFLIAYRYVDGTETAPSISWTANVAWSSVIIQMQNVAAGTPFGAVSSNAGSGFTSSTAAIVSTANKSIALYLFSIQSVTTGVGNAAGFTQIMTDVGTVTLPAHEAGQQNIDPSGTTSSAVSIANDQNTNWQVALVELFGL